MNIITGSSDPDVKQRLDCINNSALFLGIAFPACDSAREAYTYVAEQICINQMSTTVFRDDDLSF